jgi:dipeptidyl aminopeptidase/acylaminoacyl peptidase
MRACVMCLLVGCAGRAVTSDAPKRERIAIIAAERGSNGMRLVAIDERGDRRFEVIAPVLRGTVRDTNPAISPDGRWLVFASTRDRSEPDTTSLWLAPIGGAEVPPVRITNGSWIDSHPVWRRDGSGIVFASTREGGDFDLFELALRDGRPGEPVQLTTSIGHEITPAVTPDGAIIFAAVTPLANNEVESHLEERSADGTVRTLTGGPADTSPALSPDGKTIVFSRPHIRGEQKAVDGELWQMTRGSELATQLADTPLTDESGPVFSRDGRFVFATSVLRGAEGNVLFSSVVHVELGERRKRVRILGDTAGPIERLTPAIAANVLDARTLRDDPEYLPELARIMAKAIAKARMQPQAN